MTRARSKGGKPPETPRGPARAAGRPPRIDRAAIARAALEVGLERATMRRVAERLGVQPATLYHHVRGKRDLLRLAGESSLRSVAIPRDRGEHWSAWLLAYGRAGRASLLSRPELLQQIATGALGLDQIVDAIETALAVLTRQGFSSGEAVEAFLSVSQCAIGAVIYEMRQSGAREPAEPLRQELLRATALRRPDELAHLRRLLRAESDPFDHGRFFERQMHALLVGIADLRGEDWRSFLRVPPA